MCNVSVHWRYTWISWIFYSFRWIIYWMISVWIIWRVDNVIAKSWKRFTQFKFKRLTSSNHKRTEFPDKKSWYSVGGFFSLSMDATLTWVAVVSWLNNLILDVSLWGSHAQYLVNCVVDRHLDSSALLHIYHAVSLGFHCYTFVWLVWYSTSVSSQCRITLAEYNLSGYIASGLHISCKVLMICIYIYIYILEIWAWVALMT